MSQYEPFTNGNHSNGSHLAESTSFMSSHNEPSDGLKYRMKRAARETSISSAIAAADINRPNLLKTP